MRTLNRNKTKLWVVQPIGATEEMDNDGFYTGQIITAYSSPLVIYLHLYPSSGEIVERLFGKDASYDMIAVSNDVVLNKDSLLFLSVPFSNYDITYDYHIGKILKSLNTYQYGLKKRT